MPVIPMHWRRHRRQFLGSFLGLLVLGDVATFPACRPSQPADVAPRSVNVSPTDGEGRLLLTREAALFTLSFTDGRITEIVSAPELGQVLSGRWSPDGTRLAYAVYEVRDRRSPVSDIFVASATGQDPVKVLAADQTAVFYQSPVWSPDGTSLYYMHTATSGQERTRQIARMELSSGQRRVVVDEVGHFDVSPDGMSLALVRSAATGLQSLILVDVETKARRELVPERLFEGIEAPRFTPDGKSLTFSAGRPSGSWNLSPNRVGSGLGDWLLPRVAYAHGTPRISG